MKRGVTRLGESRFQRVKTKSIELFICWIHWNVILYWGLLTSELSQSYPRISNWVIAQLQSIQQHTFWFQSYTLFHKKCCLTYYSITNVANLSIRGSSCICCGNCNLDNINLKTMHIIRIRSLWQDKFWDGKDDIRIMLWRHIMFKLLSDNWRRAIKCGFWLGLIISVRTESTICSKQFTNVEDMIGKRQY